VPKARANKMKLMSNRQLEKKKICSVWAQCTITIIIVLMTSIVISVITARFKREYIFIFGATLISIQLLQARRWIRAALVFSVGIAWGGYYGPLIIFISNIGADSFAEAKNFDIKEAKFWIATLSGSIHPEFNYWKLTIVSIFSILFFGFAKWISLKSSFSKKNSAQIIFAIAATAILITLQQAIYNSLSLFLKNSDSISLIKENFKSDPPKITLDAKKINLVVYIGESTSIMNMGIYGYPRNTTPKLDYISRSDPNLVVFKKVFSTHTHTTPSLLEALSFALNENEKNWPIENRKRLSVGDILVKNGIDTTLFSNQGMTGTWNQASSVVFAKSKRIFSTNSRLMGNNETEAYKPWDHEFLVNSLFGYLSGKHVDNKRIVFLHSYAGHGPYLSNIPEAFRQPVDDLFTRKNSKSVTSNDTNLLMGVDEYDSAIRYVDFSVSEAIRVVKNSQEATILLYFADHGDAAYAGLGHDSSRFIHEMVRVPLLLYFNNAAKNSNVALYEKYKFLSNKENVSTLAQIPSTLLDLLGAQLDGANPAVKTKIIGEETDHPPILLRETAEGASFLNINKIFIKPPIANNKNLIDKSDEATKVFVATTNKVQPTKTCYPRSDTFGRALRGGLVADCLEIDLIVEPNGDLNVYRPPAKSTGFRLIDLIGLASKKNIALWMSGENLNTSKNCLLLYNFLNDAKYNNRILIEFPSGIYKNKAELNSCITGLRSDKYAISYSVPENDLISCSKALAIGRVFELERSCLFLRDDIKSALDSDLFSDFSFDYRGIKAMENIRLARKLRWNTWNVSPESFNEINFGGFGMVILDDSALNNL
jgi:glucan phosphoethanolaminetransferase (alkaline phosphatase superfamily)